MTIPSDDHILQGIKHQAEELWFWHGMVVNLCNPLQSTMKIGEKIAQGQG
jgi:hypothetical protein